MADQDVRERATEIDVRRPYEKALAGIAGRASMDSEGGAFEIAAAVGDKISSADSVQDVLDAAEGGPGDIGELAGRTFRFIGGSLRWYKSAEKFRAGGTGFYAVFDAMEKANQLTISTGATNVVFQLRRLEELGVFDNAGELSADEFTIKYRETANGTLYRIAAP